MKTITSLLVGLFCSISAISQNSEFQVYPNGLIYSEQTMGKLSHIVDSLNLKYKSCNLNTVFRAIPQAIGHIVTIEKENIKTAKLDMKNQIPFDEFLKKYPKTKVNRDVLILKSKRKNYDDKKIVEFEHFNLTGYYGFSIESEDLSLYIKDFTNQWLYEISKKSNNTEESLTAFYFPTNFMAPTIPQKYSEMIGYSDCLIDTMTTKFKEKREVGSAGLPENWTTLTQDEKAKLLDEMRSTTVIGYCSQDSRPRTHAVNIALLSAETYNWEVFLKSHLDIMNDRFDRVSDGNYAWEGRKTYIKELEELNINVSDIVLGISFRMENPARNHYFGNISRLGRALSETQNTAEIEQTMLSIISDPDLDNYNRLLIYYLFHNYNYHVSNEAKKLENTGKLATAVNTLPVYLSEKLKKE